jgi:CHASE1-domain containing sensor protein
MNHNEPTTFHSTDSKPKLFWLPLGIFIIGILVASYLDKQQMVENQQHIQTKLNDRLEQIGEAVVNWATLYEYGLRGLKGAILATGFEDFSYAKMQVYSESRDIEREFPGARGFGFIRYVAPQQQAEFVEYARQDRPDKTLRL